MKTQRINGKYYGFYGKSKFSLVKTTYSQEWICYYTTFISFY